MTFYIRICSNDNAKALLYLHENGWVHRDISVGNLYLYTDPVSEENRGLIGDFEYAKRVVGGGKPDVRTVCDQIYFFGSYTDEIGNINRGPLTSWPRRSDAGRITF